jgi:lysophospholipase L1-like esterase
MASQKAPALSGGPRPVRPARPSVPWPRRVLYLCVPFGLFFLLLAGIETYCRHSEPRLTPLEVFVRAPEQKTGFTDRYQVSVFEGDPRLFWRVKPNLKDVIWDFTLFSTNNLGLRYAHDLGPKSPRGFRVACFGDSVTFGYRVPTVWPERPDFYDRSARPYSELLETALTHANPDRPVEVIPFAVPGFSSHQGVAWAREVLPTLNADVVVIAYGWNDINLRGLTDRESMNVDGKQVLLRRMMMKSEALLRASAWWQSRHGASPAGPPSRDRVTRVLGPEYVENVREIATLAQANGALPVVLAPVYRDPVTDPGEAQRIGEHRRLLRDATTGARLPYLEIPQLTETAWPANGPLFGERIHPGDLGHRLMAAALLEFMATHGMLKDLHVPAADAALRPAPAPAP